MTTLMYETRRRQIEHYFDHQAVDAWKALTSDAPVSRIRATVRAGRDAMRATLLDWLPHDLSSRRILDAGCGTGSFAIEAARRGAEVVAVDLSPALIALAKERAGKACAGDSHKASGGRITFAAGDMLDSALGSFDHVVAMDSLIHYSPADSVAMLARLASRTRESMVVTHAPRTPALTLMHAVGRFFPWSNRAPAIEPVDASVVRRHIATEPALSNWRIGRTHRVTSGFYISQALELIAR